MKIVFTPDWFLGNDVLINFVSFSVLFLFFLFAFKSYRINHKKSILYIGIGFLLIAMGELSTILTKLVLYYDSGVTQEIGRAIIESKIVGYVDIFYYTGFFLNKFLILLGLYTIYKLPSSKRISGEFIFTTYLLLVVAMLSSSAQFFYHLTMLIILVLIIKNYYKIYKKDKVLNTQILIYAFSLLAISQIAFMVSKLNYFYVGAQSIQLISYIILLGLIMKITKNDKKKKQNGHNS